MLDIFDILGPVMVGPSSSHTAGAVRIGSMARTLLGDEPVEAKIHLHGSFAETGPGHGTDRALVAGLLGMKPDDLRIPYAYQERQKAWAGVHHRHRGTAGRSPQHRRDRNLGRRRQKAGASGVQRTGGGRILVNKAGRHRRQLRRHVQHPGHPKPGRKRRRGGGNVECSTNCASTWPT